MVDIGNTAVAVAAILLAIAMRGGNGMANAVVNGADLVSVACLDETSLTKASHAS